MVRQPTAALQHRAHPSVPSGGGRLDPWVSGLRASMGGGRSHASSPTPSRTCSIWATLCRGVRSVIGCCSGIAVLSLFTPGAIVLRHMPVQQEPFGVCGHPTAHPRHAPAGEGCASAVACGWSCSAKEASLSGYGSLPSLVCKKVSPFPRPSGPWKLRRLPSLSNPGGSPAGIGPGSPLLLCHAAYSLTSLGHPCGIRPLSSPSATWLCAGLLHLPVIALATLSYTARRPSPGAPVVIGFFLCNMLMHLGGRLTP